MTQENKSLLLKDLCARLPYHVMVHYHHQYSENGKDVIYDENRVFDYFEAETIEHTLEEPEINWPDEYWKPYLRSMSSMTNEERGRYMEFIEWSHNDYDGTTTTCINKEQLHEYLDFIYSHHLDSLGLIRMGIALEAPEGMYKTQ